MKKKMTALVAGIIILAALLFQYKTQYQTDLTPEQTNSSTSDDGNSRKETFATTDSAQSNDSQSTETDSETESDTSQTDSTDTSAFSEAQLPEHLQYYYGILTDEDKLLYREIYVVMRDHLDYTNVETTDSDTIATVMEYVLLDNPELFYIDSLKTQTTTLGSETTVSITASESLDETEQAGASHKIEDFTEYALSGISDSMSDYEKALHIYTYIVSHLEYVLDAPYNQSLYSAALGQTVCRGYTCAFKYLCDKLGIPCIVVTGHMEEESHAWNMVYLDGQWCYVDCTAADDLSEQNVDVDYSWFGLDTATLSLTHTFRNASLLPAANSMANDYYYRNGLYFDRYTLESVADLLGAGNDFSFKCQTEAVFNEYCDQFSGSQDIAQAIGAGKEVRFLGNSKTYTIYVEFQ